MKRTGQKVDNRPTVYIVDDDISIRKGLGRLVQSAGYRTETFASAVDFLEYDRNCDTASCLVLDIMMPEKNGLELQEELALREQPIPIIFITGHGNIPTSVKAMKKGAVDFLTKPFDDEALLAAVRAALEKDKGHQEAALQKKKILQRFENLTAREYEIMTYVISGMLNKQIASALDIAEKTVKVHRARVFAKVDVDSLAALVRLTEKAGIQPAERE